MTRIPPGRYREALDVTAGAIRSRASYYRTLVVGVVAVVFISALLAAVERSWLPLAGLSLAVPLCAAFFSLDEWLVNRWRQRILAMWGTTDFDLATLRRMLTSVDVLPARTVTAMLETLPSALYGLDSNAAPYRTREMLGALLHGLAVRSNYRSIATTAAYAVVVVSALSSLAVGSWRPMAALGLVPILLVSARVLGAYRLRRAVPDLATLKGPEVECFTASAAQLGWRA